jgi:glutamate-ammonia-ligase adenylyltransferase
MQGSLSPLLEPKHALYLKFFSEVNNPALQSLLLYSDYAARHVELLKGLVEEKDYLTPLFFEDYKKSLTRLQKLPLPSMFEPLRCFRHRAFLRLMLRELGGFADTLETMRSWSDCADALILYGLTLCEHALSQQYGDPVDESNQKTAFSVLAMGKLGGRELNYSSDIDLIFIYTKAGFTNGAESISNQEYYSKMAQLLIQLFEKRTADGFVFRVDLRLRPNGESGALVSSLAAIETYYQEQGRDWERYAMVKARVVGASENPPEWFGRLITPFVYRKYIDFSVIESLRSMKALIEREIVRNPMLDDIKRGMGGIREIEFILQNIQLIRGGRIVKLRCQGAIETLKVLEEEQLLPKTAVLKAAYLFFRKLENALQGQNDQQTHTLPKDALRQAQIALAMKYTHWEDLLAKLQRYQRVVRRIFHSMLGTDESPDKNALITNQMLSLWQGHIESTMAAHLLESFGYSNPARCYQLLHAFRHSPRCRRLPQAARMRLDRLMCLLLNELAWVKETDAILLSVLQLLENIVGRSAYLALLTENPLVLKELLHWFGISPFITQLLVTHPFLLEVLLDQTKNWRIPSFKQLEKILQNELEQASDPEMQEELLRQFKLKNWLIAARVELYEQIDALRIGRFLSDTAEVIVVQVAQLACQQLSERYPAMKALQSDFAIIAYGKFGSQEMNFNSDLDLVFVHAKGPDERLITRLTQKILHMLTTRTQSGILYPVDTRLRPSGSAGLLVSSMEAFANYQCSKAWTWEHQALVRARLIAGDKPILNAFNALKRKVLLLHRAPLILQQEVQMMRAKIDSYNDPQHIKYQAGGLLDLEFLVQFLVLANPHVAFSKETNTGNLLKLLFDKAVLTKDQFAVLKEAYQQYHAFLHQMVLHTGTKTDSPCYAQVHALIQAIMSSTRQP